MQGKSQRERCTFIAHVSGCLSASHQKVSPMFGRMTKSNGTIRPHSDGKWLLRVSAGRDVLTGKRLQPSRVVSGSFDEAKRQLLHFQLEVMQGDLVNSSPTLDSLFENWLNAPAKNGRPRSSASVYADRGRYRRYVQPGLGSRQVSTLRPKDFSILYDALIGRMKLSPGSVSLVHSMLRAMFNWAWRREIVQDNPVLRAEHPRKSWVPPVAPERDEVIEHCSILREENPDLGLAVWMVATLGLRRSEVLALRWSHINFDRKVITINEGITKTPGSSYVVTSTKTGSSGHAKFPLHPQTAQELLERWSKLQAKLDEAGIVTSRDAFIFSSDFAHAIPWNPDTISHAVSKHCKRHPEVPRVTLRLLRRYGVSDLAGTGVDEVTASAILRNGPETARRHYQAVRHDHLRSATLGIAERLLKSA